MNNWFLWVEQEPGDGLTLDFVGSAAQTWANMRRLWRHGYPATLSFGVDGPVSLPA